MPVICIGKSHTNLYFTGKITPTGVKQSISLVKTQFNFIFFLRELIQLIYLNDHQTKKWIIH